jgi:hypothetical protein
MPYPEFTLSYKTNSVTIPHFYITKWGRSLVEPDSNDLYKGIAVRINGSSLHRWSLSLRIPRDIKRQIEAIHKESTFDRFNKGLPESFDVTLIDNAEDKLESKTHKILIGTCNPTPYSCDRYEIELELIESPDYAYVPSFSIGGVSFNQSEITSYDSSAVISEGEPNLWQWSLGLILDSAKMTSLGNVYNAQVLGKSTAPYTGWGVLVVDEVGSAPVGMKAEIMSFSHTVSVRGFEVQISLSALRPEADAEALTFTIGNVIFAGKEIQSANKSPLVTRSIEIIPTGATVVRDNCGPGVWQWNCSFESTRLKCDTVAQLAWSQRSIQLDEGTWLVPVADGVNGGGADCAIESASIAHIPDKPGKYTLSVDLRQVNT